MKATWLALQLSRVAEAIDPFAGVVVDSRGAPIAGAVVKVQASGRETTTDLDGRFVLTQSPDRLHRAVIAAGKPGYLNSACTVASAKQPCAITLKEVPARRFATTDWTHPSRADARDSRNATKQPCRDCHPRQFSEWKRSTHASSSVNPAFLDAFSGGPRFVDGLSFKRDFPASAGTCATCHVPAQAAGDPFGAHPQAARGVERAGISCDVCHKTADTETNADGARPGVLSMRFIGPPPGEKLFFGPLADALRGNFSYAPAFKESRFCAPCHSGVFWKNLAYSEFAEWSASSYARRGISCQACHMKPHAQPARVATAKAGGLMRPAAENAAHSFPGASLFAAAVGLTITARVVDDRLRVTASVLNSGAGHHLPTGSPARNVVLTIAARDARGKRLPLIEGPVVPAWAGHPRSGQPGRGFAKIFASAVAYERKTRDRSTAIFPAPYWRAANIVSDTRIPANATDVTEFAFSIAAPRGPITVTARLEQFRFYAAWLKDRTIKPMGVVQRKLVVSP